MKKRKTRVEILLDGVDQFEENEFIIQMKLGRSEPYTAKELLSNFHPKYHGFDKPGCLLVKKRLENVGGSESFPHYLSIYTCLSCGYHVECLRSGWEIGWWGGRHVSSLK